MVVALLGGAVGLLLAQWALGAVVALGRRPDSAGAGDSARSGGAGVLAAGDARHRAGDRPAARVAGGARERATRRSRKPAAAPPAAGQRLRAGLLVAEVSLSLVLLIAAGLLLTSFARLQRVAAGLRARGRLHRATGAAAAALRPRQAGRLLRAVLSTPGDAARQHVGRAHRSRAADRRADAGAGGGHGPARAADERTPAREPPPRVAEVLHARCGFRSAPGAISTSATARACRTS